LRLLGVVLLGDDDEGESQPGRECAGRPALGRERLDDIGVAGRAIVALDTIRRHVVKLPRIRIRGHEFPVSGSHCAIAFVLPEKRLRPRDCAALERRTQAHALHRLDGLTFVLARVRCAGDIEDRRQHVDDVRRPMLEAIASARRNAPRPTHDQRRGNAAFVGEMLEPAERRTAERGPVHAEIQIRVGSAWRLAVEPPVGTTLGVGTVVRQEQDHRVVEHAAGFQSLDQLSYVRVDGVNHRGVNSHQMIESILRIVGK